MFKDVLSIGGKPGLFRMVSHAKNYIIVESLIDGKRTPSYQNEKISLLRDIVMYGNSGEKRLNELFKAAFELEDGKKNRNRHKKQRPIAGVFCKSFPGLRQRPYLSQRHKEIYQLV